ncbi:hypothetical protein C8F04DRAFT_1178316 [Mycena alexandri]|uniref:Uncharacterized protein n=1 Tax=Mycena alexandri TaxID=1745969 RepID=A0AAD6T550_9AGAR|nr:hypothetical protein C8F04DRAFT_1178316 [Mycena alexandri]
MPRAGFVLSQQLEQSAANQTPSCEFVKREAELIKEDSQCPFIGGYVGSILNATRLSSNLNAWIRKMYAGKLSSAEAGTGVGYFGGSGCPLPSSLRHIWSHLALIRVAKACISAPLDAAHRCLLQVLVFSGASAPCSSRILQMPGAPLFATVHAGACIEPADVLALLTGVSYRAYAHEPSGAWGATLLHLSMQCIVHAASVSLVLLLLPTLSLVFLSALCGSLLIELDRQD